jgi:hypothetical protein
MSDIGLKVVCIKGQALDWRLKIGERYTVRDIAFSIENDKYYVVSSNNGERVGWVSEYYFKPISMVREDKLNQLGI